MKNLLILNLILAFTWMAVQGSFTFVAFMVGFILGYVVISVLSVAIDDNHYVKTVLRSVTIIFFFLKELFLSSIRVAIDVLKPSFKMKSGIVAIPLDVKTDFEITFLANMISLTPGTLSLDVSDDKKTLFIHSMYIDKDADTLRKEIKGTMERKVLELTRN